MARDQLALLIGESMQVEGSIGGSGDVEVRGAVRGRISLNDHLWVAETGTVDAELHAAAATVDGSLGGSLTILGALDVRAGASVTGHLRAATLSLSDAASFDGEVDMPVELPPQLSGQH